MVANRQNANTQITGVTPDYLGVRNWQVAEGDFIGDEQVASRALVAVLGATTARNLFGDGDPLGQTVRVNNVSAAAVSSWVMRPAPSNFVRGDAMPSWPTT